MSKGTLIFGIIIALIVIHFFGFTVFLWSIPIVAALVVIFLFYKIFLSEGWVPDISDVFKKAWKRYLKWERKLFNWIDKYF